MMQKRTARRLLIMVISMSMILGNSSMLAFAGEAAPTEAAPTATIVNTPAEFAEAVGNIEVGNVEPVTIDTATGEVVTESGEETTLEEVFNMSAAEAEELTASNGAENLEAIEEYLDEQGAYEVRESGASEIEVAFPYACKEIVVFIDNGELGDSYGASSVVYNTILDQYVLGYETEAEAKAAYDSLAAEFGRDRVIASVPMMLEGYNQTRTSVTPAESVSWGNDFMMLDSLRDKYNESDNTDTVTVAILDSGINKSKALFDGRRISEYSASFVKGTDGPYDYYDDSSKTSANYGHGTHVAGIVADGTSKQVELMILKVFGSNSISNSTVVFSAVAYAAQHGADIINMSLSTNLYDSSPEVEAIFDTYLKRASEAGCILISSAGNDSSNMDTLHTYPANSPYVHAVSALRYAAGRGPLFDSSYSNYGSAVEYIAPGSSVISAFVGDSSEYQTMSGTSMAAPHVAAAYAMSKLMNPGASNAEIEAFVNSHTVDGGDAGRDPKYGYGAIIMNEAQEEDSNDTPESANDDGGEQNPGTDKPSGSDDGKDPGTGNNPSDKDPESGSNTPAETIKVKPSVTLGTKSVVYTGKTIRPEITVKDEKGKTISTDNYTVSCSSDCRSIGTHKISVSLKNGMEGSASATLTIQPKKTNAKISSRGKTQMTIKWTAVTAAMPDKHITGYQIQVAKNSRFTSGLKKYTVTGYSKNTKKFTSLKRHTKYYVRVRTYAKVGGTTVYSPWSSYRSTKTK